MGAVRQFSGVWHGKDFRSMFCRHQAPGGMGRTADSRDPHDLSPPRGGHTVLRPLPHEESGQRTRWFTTCVGPANVQR